MVYNTHMDAPTLSLHLLGPFLLERATAAPALSSRTTLRRKTRALLAYLAVTARPHTRQQLAAIFFPKSNDPLGALRWQLSQIRRHVGADTLEATAESVALSADALAVDVHRFDRQLQANLTAITLAELTRVLHLYRGDFLTDLTLPDAPDFDLWLLGQRAHYQRLYEQGLTTAVTRLTQDERWPDALPWAQRLVQIDPLLEEAHLQLAKLYAHLGQRDAALDQLDHCTKILHDELAVEPTPALVDLRAAVTSGEAVTMPKLVAVPIMTAPDLRGSSTIVGRAEELAGMQHLWRACQQGQGKVALIAAEAGGGKTRLCTEFTRPLPPRQVLMGIGYESMQSQPYRPWIDLLEASFTALNAPAQNQPDQSILEQNSVRLEQLSTFWLTQLLQLVPTLAAHVPNGTDLLSSQSTPNQEYLFAAVAEFLDKVIAAPCVLVIDDLQWADESSLRLFHFVAQRTARLPVLLVGAFRSEEAAANPHLQTLLRDLERNPLERINLTPLAADAVDELLARMWPELPPGFRPHVSEMLHHATGGNPLFVTEVLRELRHTEEPPDDLPVPESIRALVNRRLQRLPTGNRQVFEALSVLGTPATLEVARQTSARSEEEAVDAIELGLRQGILIGTTTSGPSMYNFTHDLVREAVMAQLSPVRRQVLHRRAAETLERTQASPAILTYHWHLAGDRGKEGHFALRAGEQAQKQAANTEALALFTRALALLPADALVDRFRALMAKSQTYMVLGDHDAQEADLVRAQAIVDALDDDEKHAELIAHYSVLHTLRGNFIEACTFAERSVARARAAKSTRLEAEGCNYWGMALWRLNRLDEAEAQLEQSYKLARALSLAVTECNSLILLGNIASSRAEIAKAVDYFGQALPIAKRHGFRVNESTLLNNLGLAAFQQGDYGTAFAYYQQAEPIASTIGFRLGQANTRSRLGALYLLLGALARAESAIQQAADIYRDLNYPRGVNACAIDFALLYSVRGEHERAEALLRQAAQQAQQWQDNVTQHLIGKRLGHLYLGTERWAKAVTAYQEAMAVSTSADLPWQALECMAGVAFAHFMQGDHATARTTVDQLLTQFDAEQLDGISDPLRIYFACYQIRQHQNHPDAEELLLDARQLLMTRAETIPDRELRDSYLTAVPLHAWFMNQAH